MTQLINGRNQKREFPELEKEGKDLGRRASGQGLRKSGGKLQRRVSSATLDRLMQARLKSGKCCADPLTPRPLSPKGARGELV